MAHDIFLMFRNGEAVPFIILALILIGYVIVFERFALFRWVYKINFNHFNTQLQNALQHGDFDKARALIRDTSDTGLPKLALRAIDTFEQTPHQIQAHIAAERLRFFPRIRRRLHQLPSLAAACVILGAFASVNGVWNAFQMVEGLELGVKSLAFSSGLSQAMLPLSISLLGAFLLILPFGILDAMATRLENEMEYSLCVLAQALTSGKSHENEKSSLYRTVASDEEEII